MAKDVVCSESEFSIAVNNILNYVDFQQRQIDQYCRMLEAVRKGPIKDPLISVKLMALEMRARMLSNSIANAVDTQLKPIIEADVSEIEAANNFAYPDALLGAISAILAQFL